MRTKNEDFFESLDHDQVNHNPVLLTCGLHGVVALEFLLELTADPDQRCGWMWLDDLFCILVKGNTLYCIQIVFNQIL